MTEPEICESLKAAGVPAHLHGGIVRYCISGLRPGGFLTAVIMNDLLLAVCRADDDVSMEEMRAVCRWLYNDAPSACRGSAEAMARWVVAKEKEYGVVSAG